MNHIQFDGVARRHRLRRVGGGALALLLVAGLAACGKSDTKSGQALVKVGSEEITALQLNEELARSGVPGAQQQQARPQILASLVDRQLLINEAIKDKTDRDPKVVQAIERAKSLILAQAYLQKKVGTPAKPTKEEVKEYFDKHPALFSQRKTIDMRQLVLPTADLTDALKKDIDAAKTLEDVAALLDRNNVKYARNQISRSYADLAPALGDKLLSLPKGQLFIIREGERSTVVTITDVRDTPVELAASTPQIEQYLMNTRGKEAAAAELARLRAATKIEYTNKADEPAAPGTPGAAPAAPVAAPAAATPAGQEDAHARGVAGLK
ncbi:EpsD family peptidyl-prolyl cis-trans isomerase [Oxalobacteraceae bacterium OTU3REALA1]|nr:EpsD family peptidyl-prolyl cis-trans isomerase [Oxalobacteraceae bacterium OTU3REALA1]